MQKKKGISLIVLVITIIVMIILAAAIILSLNNAGIIGNANKAVEMTNDKTIQTAADLKYAEYILKNDIIGSSTVGEWIKSELIKEGIIPKGQENNYNITDAGKVIDNREYSTIQKEARALYEKMLADGSISTMLNQGDYIKQQLISNKKINESQAEKYRFKNNGDVIKLQTKAEYEAMYKEELATLDSTYYEITDGVFKLTTLGKETIVSEEINTLVIPYGVTTVGVHAVFNNQILTKIVIPDTVTTIQDAAFASCTNVEDLILSKNLQTVGIYILPYNNKWMVNKKNESGSNGIVIENGILFFAGYDITEVNIPNSVDAIAPWAFEYCTKLTNAIIPSSVSKIGDYAFCGVTTLTNVEFKGQIPEIGFGSFALTNLPEIMKQQLIEKNSDVFNDEL